MTFPVTFHLLGLSLPAHQVMELLGYSAGFKTFVYLHRKQTASPGTPGKGRGEGLSAVDSHRAISPEQLAWLIVAAVCGAAIGSKILAIIESFPSYWAARGDPKIFLEGKTIVGGILGGWAAVELAKKLLHIRGSSSEAYAPGLCIGIAIGRIGCFLTGLPDHTYGIVSSLPWAVDFGDGIRRHPTQLYESLFALVMFVVLIRLNSASKLAAKRGLSFRLFILAYMSFRFLVEFIKPVYHPYAGLSAIQIASLIGATIAAWHLFRRKSVGWASAHRESHPVG